MELHRATVVGLSTRKTALVAVTIETAPPLTQKIKTTNSVEHWEPMLTEGGTPNGRSCQGTGVWTLCSHLDEDENKSEPSNRDRGKKRRGNERNGVERT